MAELLGIEKLTSSFGLVTMCQGLSAFIGAPIAGKQFQEFFRLLADVHIYWTN